MPSSSSDALLRFIGLAIGLFSAAASAQIAYQSASTAMGTTATAIAHAGSGVVANRENCGDVSPAIPGGAVGDILIALVNARENGATLSASAGWTALLAPTVYAGQELQAAIYYRVATGVDALTVTQSGTCSSLAARVARFSGVDTGSPFDGSPTYGLTSQNASSVAASGLTTTVPDTMAIMASVVMDDRTVSATGWSESFDTALDVASDLGIALHYQLQPATGAKSVSGWTLSGGGSSDPSIGVIFALKAAAQRWVSIAVPAGTAAGDLLVASLAVRHNAATVVAPSGWTLVRDTPQTSGAATCADGSTAGIRLLSYYKVAGAGEPTADFVYGSDCYDSGFGSGGMLRFTGVDPSNPIVASVASTTASSTLHAAPSVTPGVSDAMLVTVHSYGSSRSWNQSYAGVSTMSERVDQRSYGADNGLGATLAMYTEALTSSAATGTRTAQGAGDADAGATHSLALRPTSADLALTMVRSGALTAGGTAYYTLTVSNNGPAATAGTTSVVDTLPSGLTYTGFAGSGWSCSAAGQTVTCTTTSVLASGGSSALTINVSVATSIGGTVTNTATVSGAVLDTSTANNTASDSYEVPLSCFTDDFNRSSLGGDWSATSSSGSFGVAQIVGNRLRLTDAGTNVATAAHLQRMFPGSGNKIVVEFDHYAYGGTGADGIAVTLSDASITPQAGAYGGSLGYAQRTGVNGFGSGWLGVGIDEYGNFRNDDEGRGDGGGTPTGLVPDSISVRGSGSGTTGYLIHAESGTLSPGVDQVTASITHVGAGAEDDGDGNVTPGLPTHQTGDLLLCAATSNDNNAHSVSTSGWSAVYQIAQSATTQPRSSLFYKVATSAAETAPTITHSSGGIVAGCSAFRGVDTTNPFDVAYATSHYADTTDSTNVTSGSMTTVTANAMMLFVGHVNDNTCSLSASVAGGLTWSQSFCRDSNQGADELVALHYATKATAGAIGPITFTHTGNDDNRGVLLALRPLVGGSSAYRHRITVDHSDAVHAYVKVERNTGAGYTTVIPQYDAKAQSGQTTVPTNWLLSYTGSTGSLTNIHEIDNLSVCTTQQILPTLDHVRLNHTGSAVTCLGEQVTVHACSSGDASGSCTATTASGVSGNVVAKDGSNQTVATVAFSIPSGSSSTTVTVPVTTAQTVTFETSNLSVTPSATQAWTCWNGSIASCSNTFSDAGFIVASYDAAGPTCGSTELVVPTHTAGTASVTYCLRAVKTDKKTKVCEAALQGPNSVNFAYECVSPATCYASNLMNVNGGTDTTISRNGNGSVSSYTPVAMTFDANGNAPFTFNYSDAGQVRLHMAKAAGGSLLAAVNGSSNAFIVKPAAFVVKACTGATPCTVANAAATDGSGAVFAKAGAAFNATVVAVASTGTTTPSFGGGTDASSETVAVATALAAPTGGNAGTLGGTGTGDPCTPAPQTNCLYRSAFADGVASVSNLSWSEAGVMTLTAQNTTFHAAALETTGTSGNVGRFTPDHFAVTAGALTHGCSDAFTYLGQDGFTTAFTLTAQNAANGTTKNYIGDFAKLGLTAWSNFAFTASNLPAGSTLAASATAPTGAWSEGAASVTAKHQASRPASLVNAATTVRVSAQPADSDGVTMASPAVVQTSDAVLRYGRLWLGNAFGSDRSSLSVPYELQYWNGLAFVRNTADACTTFATGNLGLGNYQGTLHHTAIDPPAGKKGVVSSVTAVTASGTGGGGTITVPAPTLLAGSTAAAGSADLVLGLGAATGTNNAWTPDVSPTAGAAKDYLRYKWYGTAYDRDPTARATFGVFGSSLRKGPIYIRENY